ncbi:MAG: hypothetical protein KAR19_15675 [Bacteroidales bacterium]|nr:hypothetical protein [Bacteroidales bacterium]
MKRFFFLLPAVLISYLSFSQTVENIRVEPDGDNIKISYRIGGSTESQLYNVVLTCSMDGGQRFEPQSVIGDVGQNIRGGKSFYTVIWDVFEDIEEVGNGEFFVRIKLISDASTPFTSPRNQPRQRVVPIETKEASSSFRPGKKTGSTSQTETFHQKLFIAYNGSVYNPYGFSVGTIGNWGLYGSLRLGNYNEYKELFEGSVTAGITKFLIAKEKFRLHGYAGGGKGDFLDEFAMEAGVIGVVMNRLNLSLGFTYITNVNYGDLVFGIGIVF